MDLQSVIRDLQQKREAIDRALTALLEVETVARRGRPPKLAAGQMTRAVKKRRARRKKAAPE
jgi:hypothetical protein